MSIARVSISNKTTTLFLSLVLTVAGVAAFFSLGQLEDPTFTVKTAMVMTAYPGASAQEVAEEVTEPIETHLQRLEELKRLRSVSMPGLSIVYVDILDKYTKDELPQIWDKLRNKTGDAQAELPPGAGPVSVNSDYGDVYGMYYALSGDGYSYRDLWHVADYMKKQLLLVKGVKRVDIAGDQGETIYVELSRSRMTQFGISPEQVTALLAGQNLVTPAGAMTDGNVRLRVTPTGAFDSVESIGELLISTGDAVQVKLSDVARVTRGYVDPPVSMVRINGRPAVTIGVSNAAGAQVPKLGEAVNAKIAEILPNIPAGMTIEKLYDQPAQVTAAVDSFLANLWAAVAIVVVLLLLFMGLRSGLLMGAVLLFTILGTLLLMKIFEIEFHSVSLAAMIIALGMLVDNAIVIADGMLVRLQTGQGGERAAEEIVGLTMWPLFGATIIAVLAFMPIGFSPDSTGEFCFSIFSVVGLSLILSWVTAVTVTPLWGAMYLRGGSAGSTDPYDTPFYRRFRGFLDLCARFRYMALCILVCMLALSVVAFGWLQQTFFPPDPKPFVTADMWLPQGTDIAVTSKAVAEVESFLQEKRSKGDVVRYTAFIGEGAMRFVLNYSPEDPTPRYAQLILEAKDKATSLAVLDELRAMFAARMPQAVARVGTLQKGSTVGARIEVRFMGDAPDVLRDLADKAYAVMKTNPRASGLRLDWGNRIFSVSPNVIEPQARQAGLTRAQITKSLLLSTDGVEAGLYREGKLLIPIVARLSPEDRTGPAAVQDAQIWSEAIGKYVPLAQITSGVLAKSEDVSIYRRNRIRTLTVNCNVTDNLNISFLNELRPAIDKIPLPPGYTLQYGGEFESSGDAMRGLTSSMPVTFLLMVSIVMILFNSVRAPLTILLTVPLSLISVVFGLYVMHEPFSFMALLGFLSLSGMQIKNSIVLLDQANEELRLGRTRYEAIMNAAVSRARPVMMGAMTTVLGMIPLIWDILFAPLAVTVMFGLTLATILILVVVPIIYVTLYRVPSPDGKK